MAFFKETPIPDDGVPAFTASRMPPEQREFGDDWFHPRWLMEMMGVEPAVEGVRVEPVFEFLVLKFTEVPVAEAEAALGAICTPDTLLDAEPSPRFRPRTWTDLDWRKIRRAWKIEHQPHRGVPLWDRGFWRDGFGVRAQRYENLAPEPWNRIHKDHTDVMNMRTLIDYLPDVLSQPSESYRTYMTFQVGQKGLYDLGDWTLSKTLTYRHYSQATSSLAFHTTSGSPSAGRGAPFAHLPDYAHLLNNPVMSGTLSSQDGLVFYHYLTDARDLLFLHEGGHFWPQAIQRSRLMSCSAHCFSAIHFTEHINKLLDNQFDYNIRSIDSEENFFYPIAYGRTYNHWGPITHLWRSSEYIREPSASLYVSPILV